MTASKPFALYYDAIIVGARCAGAATAMLLARSGASVLVVDWAEEGSDIMSTHAMMRGAVMQLNRWGVLEQIIAAGTPTIRKTTFHYGGDAIPLDIKPSHGVDALYAPRRPVLDGALVAAAREAGADVRFGVSFRDVSPGRQGRVVGAVLRTETGEIQNVRAGIVIGADGRRSGVARRVEAPVERMAQNSIACVYAYYDGIVDDGTHWYYQSGMGAGKIPTNDGRHCVFVGLSRAEFDAQVRGGRSDDPVQDLLGDLDPGFSEGLISGQKCSDVIAFAGHHGHMRRSWGNGWALVGDSGYFKDPLTAHGITDALRDAEILAQAVLHGSSLALADYQAQRDELSRELFDITDEIAGFDWTLPELQALHMRLNKAMKLEQNWMYSGFDQAMKAA